MTGADDTVLVWDLSDDEPGTMVAFDEPDEDDLVDLVDLVGEEEAERLDRRLAAVAAVGLSGVAGRESVLAATGGALLFGDPDTGLWDETLVLPGGPTGHLDASVAGGRAVAVTGAEDCTVCLVDLERRDLVIAPFRAHEGEIIGVRVLELDGRPAALTDKINPLWAIGQKAGQPAARCCRFGAHGCRCVAGAPTMGNMKLTTMTQITVDGVMQGNGHATPEELASGFTRDGWALGAFADDTGEMISATYQRADAFLFGRRTYEMFAETWGTRPEMQAHPIGVALNGAQKYVASNSLQQPLWGPVTLLSGDATAAIRELKESSSGEIQVHGSATLIRSLLAAGLVDELTLLVVPVLLGQGMRLFPDDGPDIALEVISSHTDARGVGVHVYRPVGQPEYHPARPT